MPNPKFGEPDKRGIFNYDDRSIDDAMEEEPRVTRAGVFLTVDCGHCGGETTVQLPWPEVSRMAQHAPVKGWAKTTGGYVAKVVCQRCKQSYLQDDWGMGDAMEEASTKVPLGLGQLRKWAAEKGSAQTQAAGAADARKDVGAKIYRKGVGVGVGCPQCGTTVDAQLPWQTLVSMAQLRPVAPWKASSGGFESSLRCPACGHSGFSVQVSGQEVNSWLQLAQQKGLVR